MLAIVFVTWSTLHADAHLFVAAILSLVCSVTTPAAACLVRKGTSYTSGYGTVVGSVKAGIIIGGSYSVGYGKVVGNFKQGLIYQSTGYSRGYGAVIGNFKGSLIYRGKSYSKGYGKVVGPKRQLVYAAVL